MTTFSTEEHWKFFAEFVDWETKAGGPDPHLTLSAAMAKDHPWDERVWRGGCYIAVYNAPFGEAIWREWSWQRICSEPEALLPWLELNWKKIITRRERRCVRRPEWMAQYLHSYAAFAKSLPGYLESAVGLSPTERYDFLWDKVLEVQRLGRYVALKLLEYYKICCEIDAELPDLRPAGGWSPRQTLGDLWPEHKEVADRDDAPKLLELANNLTEKTQQRLRAEFGLDIDKFRVQVLLCDYKQSWKGRRQYPGRSIDSEMLYAYQAEELWGVPSGVWEHRKQLFPLPQLGELNGWRGPREEPAKVLADYKYTWSDQKYDYSMTREFSTPVGRRLGRAKVDGVPNKLHTILEDRLYQSGSWNKLSPEGLKNLVDYYGITGVLSLWSGENNLTDKVGWFYHAPIPDGKVVPSDVEALADEVIAQLQSGGRIVIMCHAGRNRSGLLTALVVRKLLALSGKDALAHVRERRPRAVANSSFEAFLLTKKVPPGKGCLI